MPKNPPQRPILVHEDIATRAYQRYLERGSTHGYDIEDWLAAEQELAGARAQQPPQPQRPARRSKAQKPEAA